MTGHISRMDEIVRADERLLLDPIDSPRGRQCIIERELFFDISDYTRSQPTAPSPGRVYRKNLHWTGPPDNWFLYVCVRALDGTPKAVDHVPFSVIFL